MCAKPCSSCVGCAPRRMLARGSVVPYIGHHVLHPSLSLRTVEILRCLLSARYKLEHQLGKRKVKFAEVALLCNPVVHLNVDVGVVVTVPRCAESVCPQSLKVRWETSRTCARDQQIPSEIVVQRSEAMVDFLSVFPIPIISCQPFIGSRYVIYVRLDAESRSVVQLLMSFNCLFMKIACVFDVLHKVAGSVTIAISCKIICCCRHYYPCLVSIAYLQHRCPVLSCDSLHACAPAFCNDLGIG